MDDEPGWFIILVLISSITMIGVIGWLLWQWLVASVRFVPLL